MVEKQYFYTMGGSKKESRSVSKCWKVRELKQQMKSSLFQRLALSTDKKGVLARCNSRSDF